MDQKKQPYEGKGSITKSDLCNIYKMSATTLRSLLNKRYFDHLQPLGYQKNDKMISSQVFEKFKELWGEPI